MGQLEDMTMFVRIVEAGSITKAADQLNIAKSAVSRRLNELETRLNMQLLTRTTRTSSLTAAGVQYFERAKNILEEVDALNEQTSSDLASVEGILKITAPLSFGLMHLCEVIDEYAKAHDKLTFQLDFSDRHIDLIQEGYELAIRIGTLQDSSLHAKRLTPIRQIFCASPAYLKQHGTPQKIEELSQHAFLQYGTGTSNKLLLADVQGKPQRVEVNSKMTANNGDFLKALAIKGHGITSLPTFLAYKAIASGELVTLLSEHPLPLLHAYAVYPKNRFLSQRCRLLIEHIAQLFGDEPYWDKGL